MSFSDSAFSPDGKRLLGASHGSEAVTLWETEGYHNLLTLEADGDALRQIRFSPNGKILGAVSTRGIHLWRAPTWADIEAAERTRAEPEGRSRGCRGESPPPRSRSLAVV